MAPAQGPIHILLATGLFVLLIFGTALAQFENGSLDQRTAPADPRQGPTDPAELAAFLDGLMAVLMPDYQVAGAVVAVVQDGGVFLARGYGYADIEAREPVHPETNLFRVGSVTKLFTWNAVMQLVEQGRLDLDVDINTYLDFHIPATFPEPRTATTDQAMPRQPFRNWPGRHGPGESSKEGLR